MGRLIFRYDDTPHHTELDSFPHHKHIADEGTVERADPPDLADVLSEIELICPLNPGEIT
jgi:hypothetical protein